MTLKFKKLFLLLSVFVSIFCLTTAASAQKTENELSLADKRQIIEVVLKEKFEDSSEKMIYISTANLSDEIQKNFPSVKNKKVKFVAPAESAESDVCAFEFGEFEFIDKFASVSFGNCREGLAYDFKKYGDKWKSVGLTITKPILY